MHPDGTLTCYCDAHSLIQASVLIKEGTTKQESLSEEAVISVSVTTLDLTASRE